MNARGGGFANLGASHGARAQGGDAADGTFVLWTVAAILAVSAARLGFSALELAPMHFDESQYWTYGEDLAWGYYSKPPMVAWLIRASTEILGDTAFGVRALTPLLHAGVAWGVFAVARRLFDAQTGFWAAVTYLLAPGVTASSLVMSTDPPMMAAWTLALYATVRAMLASGPAGAGAGRLATLGWWVLAGAAIGLGLLSKYTIIAFVGGGLGYALFARQAGPFWRAPPRAAELLGPLAAIAAAFVVWSPNLLWNAANDFASIAHVGDNAKLSEGPAWNFNKLAEFFGAQFAVFGPVAFAALIWFSVTARWRHDWSVRFLVWVAAPLLIAMVIQSFLSRAHPNWAAPSYIAGAVLVSVWALDAGRVLLLRIGAAIGVVGALALYAGVAVYASDVIERPRAFDPLKKTRHNHAICARADERRGDQRVIAADRRLLADCLFAWKAPLASAQMLPTDNPGNHYALVAALDPESAAARDEAFILIFRGSGSNADEVLALFREAEVLERGAAQTHLDHSEPYTIARVRGWRGV